MDLNSRADGANIPLSTVEPEMTAEAGAQNGRLDTNPTSGFSEDLHVSSNLIWVCFLGLKTFENANASTKDAVTEAKAEEQVEEKGKNKPVTQPNIIFLPLF